MRAIGEVVDNRGRMIPMSYGFSVEATATMLAMVVCQAVESGRVLARRLRMEGAQVNFEADRQEVTEWIVRESGRAGQSQYEATRMAVAILDKLLERPGEVFVFAAFPDGQWILSKEILVNE